MATAKLTDLSKNGRLLKGIGGGWQTVFFSRRQTMMKQLVGFSVLAAFVTTVSAQSWFKGSFDGALAKAKSENKKVLVDFFSPT